MKTALKIGFLCSFVLTLTTWVLVDIYMPKTPLDSADTAIVFGFWLILSVLSLLIVKRLSRKKHEKK